MNASLCRPLIAALALFSLAACQHTAREPAPDNSAVVAPVSGFVTDRVTFDTFIAGHPTPDQFRRRYPDVHLVLPGDIATHELRSNNSRFFAELDDEGRIVGGRFQ